MFSRHLHSESIRHRPGRRLAVAVAVAAGIATGSAMVTATDNTPRAAAQSASAVTSMRAFHAGATSASFVRRVRRLEAAGYVGVACQVNGDLLLNPHTRRYVTVRV